MKLRMIHALMVAGSLAICAASGELSAQGFGYRIHQARANAFGGADCGRAITHADAEALWAGYCDDDCTLNSGGCGLRGCGRHCGRGFGGCGHAGGCFGGYGVVAGTECGFDDCGFGPRFGHRHRHGQGGCGGCGHHRGFVGVGGANCFGWPTAGYGCDGPVAGGGHCGHGDCLRGCGHHCRLFSRHHCNYDTCSPITSQFSGYLTEGCGCN